MPEKTLVCPECGEECGPGQDPTTIACKSGQHTFTMADLITAQSRKIRALMVTTVFMLDQQASVLVVCAEEMIKLNDPSLDSNLAYLTGAILRTEQLIDLLAPLSYGPKPEDKKGDGPVRPQDTVL